MENKQTAVEWIQQELFQRYNFIDDEFIFHQAKAMEKKQIKDAWINGFMSTGEGWNGEIPPECYGEVLDTEEYYKETYEK